MKGLVLFLLPLTLFAAEVTREKAKELNDAAYRLPEVAEFCTTNIEGTITVHIENVPVPVDCGLWRIWHEAQLRARKTPNRR